MSNIQKKVIQATADKHLSVASLLNDETLPCSYLAKFSMKKTCQPSRRSTNQWYNSDKSDNNSSLSTALFQTFLSNYNLRESQPSFCDNLQLSKRPNAEKNFEIFVDWRLRLLDSLHNFGLTLPCVHGYTPMHFAFIYHQDQACFENWLLDGKDSTLKFYIFQN